MGNHITISISKTLDEHINSCRPIGDSYDQTLRRLLGLEAAPVKPKAAPRTPKRNNSYGLTLMEVGESKVFEFLESRGLLLLYGAVSQVMHRTDKRFTYAKTCSDGNYATKVTRIK